LKKLTILAAVLAAASLAADPAKTDLVLKNAIIYTLDARRPHATAVAIRGNAIAAVGGDAELRGLIGPNTQVIDLAGATVIPGLVESHGHLMSLGQSRLRVDLNGARSYEEVVARVAAAVNGRADGEWVLGRGWHESKWASPPAVAVRGFPTHDALSAASPRNPVVLERADGHALLANAKAMELSAITKATKAPEGGELIRDGAGDATGIFVDNAEDLIKVPPPTPAQASRALDLALAECVRKGLTQFEDAGTIPSEIALYKSYAEAGKLPLRLYLMAAGLETLKHYDRPEIDLGRGFLTLRAVKLVADGAMGSRGAALLEPYLDDPRNSGFFTTPPEVVLETARYALAHGFQVNVHAIGDRTNRMVLDQFEAAFRERPAAKDPRFRIEHAQMLDAQDIPRFAALRVIASMQGIHATSDRPWAASRIGMDRVREGLYVWRKLLASGATIVNGTDTPVEDVDPIRNFYASVTRQDENGNPPGGFDPDQKMTREEALRSYTVDAAFAAFQEKTSGSIELGKRADLTVLSRDILTVPDREILKAEVLYTIVDGRVRYQAP
jgi:predicted amidohydrolase YtcJ